MSTRRISLFLFCLLACHANLTSAQTLAERLAGNWQYTASNNGVEVAPGIFSAGTDVIDFTATASADGTYLQCHTDCLYNRTGTAYPADWRILVVEDGNGKHRLGWVLDPAQPISSKEFKEPRENYLENGFWYWGGSDGGHRYIYLLAENADASAIIGMTFWSPWSDEGTTEYALSNEENQAQKMYAVVSENIPHSGNVGWIEIWSSPKIQHLSGSTGINKLSSPDTQHPSPIYDLQGRRLSQPAQKGIYIRDGKKYYIH